MDTANLFLHELLNIGESMLSSGGEVNRVEDTLKRMGLAYGAEAMNVFVITSSIIVTMTMADGRELTQTRRILTTGGTDFTKLEKLNSLSRSFCAQPMATEVLAAKIKRIREEAPQRRCMYLGSMLAAGSFAVFFGGSVLDGAASALIAILVCFLQEHIASFCRNKIVSNLLLSLISGIVICMATAVFPALRSGNIMIGVIMLLIPGIAMTNSIRDILVGDTISGTMRLIESLFWAGALAIGFMSALWLMGGTL